MSLSRSHIENDDERQEPTFLTKLQEIMTILEKEVLPKVEDNTHLKLVNGLQILYNLHTGSNSDYVTRNLTETPIIIIANTPSTPSTPSTSPTPLRLLRRLFLALLVILLHLLLIVLLLILIKCCLL